VAVPYPSVLMTNKSLRTIDLSTFLHPARVVRNKATFGATAFEAFSAMLRVTASLILTCP
jgi:hypothetical protein